MTQMCSFGAVWSLVEDGVAYSIAFGQVEHIGSGIREVGGVKGASNCFFNNNQIR